MALLCVHMACMYWIDCHTHIAPGLLSTTTAPVAVADGVLVPFDRWHLTTWARSVNCKGLAPVCFQSTWPPHQCPTKHFTGIASFRLLSAVTAGQPAAVIALSPAIAVALVSVIDRTASSTLLLLLCRRQSVTNVSCLMHASAAMLTA